MVETTPSVPGTPPPGPTTKVTVAWWWTSSLPITFSDPDVVAQDPDGIPKYGQILSSGEPVTPPTVVSGTWVAPKDGATLATSTLTLSAKPTMTPSTLSVAEVAFSVTWGSTTRAACSTTKAGPGGVWSCTSDLWQLGAPLGKLSLSFDVTDSAGDVAKAPAGTRTVTFAAPPPKPGDASYTLVSEKVLTPGYADTDWVYKVAWSEPADAATEFEIWVVTGCYAKRVGDPCVAPGMHIAASDRRLLATVKGTVRSYLYKFTSGFEAFWPDVDKAILVQAFNAYGASKSAIPWTYTCSATYAGTCSG